MAAAAAAVAKYQVLYKSLSTLRIYALYPLKLFLDRFSLVHGSLRIHCSARYAAREFGETLESNHASCVKAFLWGASATRADGREGRPTRAQRTALHPLPDKDPESTS